MAEQTQTAAAAAPRNKKGNLITRMSFLKKSKVC